MTYIPQVADTRALGIFKIVAHRPGYAKLDITTFRGVPTRITSLSNGDPFGDESLSFVLPAVTPLDTFGTGDLWWLAPDTDIDVFWVPAEEQASSLVYKQISLYQAAVNTSGELGKNPVFENDLSHWQAMAYGWDTSIADRITEGDPVPEGEVAVKITFPTPVLDSSGFITDQAVTAGTIYKFTAWVYVPSGQPAIEPIVYARQVGAANTIYDEWVQLSVSWTADVAGEPFFFGVHNADPYEEGNYFYIKDTSLIAETPAGSEEVGQVLKWEPTTPSAAAPIVPGIIERQVAKRVPLYSWDSSFNTVDTYVDPYADNYLEANSTTPVLASATYDATIPAAYTKSNEVLKGLLPTDTEQLDSAPPPAAVSDAIRDMISGQTHEALTKAWSDLWRWEGFIVSWDKSSQAEDFGTTVTCKGALYQVDNFLAIPANPARPLPFEILIKQAFSPVRHPSLRTSTLEINYPDDWDVLVPEYSGDQHYRQPIGIPPGEKWSGLASRSTGDWEQLLTGFVQGLLNIMYTSDGGQWTIIKNPGRKPVLKVRPHGPYRGIGTLYVDATHPGVTFNVSQDFSQTANVIYGQGVDSVGATYSNAEGYPGDATTVVYTPFSWLPEVYPPDEKENPFYDSRVPRRELHLQFQDGLNMDDAVNVAKNHLNRFSDPGYTGTLTLQVDPETHTAPQSYSVDFHDAPMTTYPRFVIMAGQKIVIRGLDGKPDGVLFHITHVDVDLEGQTVSLTIDSKYRDQLTVHEVRARAKDALQIRRLLRVSGLTLPFQDYLKPWSDEKGSGILPQGALPLFKDHIPMGAAFPWEDYTKKFPPKKYPQYYVKIGSADWRADNNWAVGDTSSGGVRTGIPVLMSEKGAIRLTEIAAFDENGYVMKVRFHVSVYKQIVAIYAMPAIPKTDPPMTEEQRGGYNIGDRYPFFPGAFENINQDGTIKSELASASDPTMIIGWGNYYQPAGYSPHLFTDNPTKTGLLRDETSWNYDLSSSGIWSQSSVAENQNNPTLGYIWAMIYCDNQGNRPVYFLGRFWRQIPGT